MTVVLTKNCSCAVAYRKDKYKKDFLVTVKKSHLIWVHGKGKDLFSAPSVFFFFFKHSFLL